MSVSIVKNQSSETYCIVCDTESTYEIPAFGSRDVVLFKNATAADMTLTCYGSDTVDGETSLTLKGFATVELIRGGTEWVAVRSYDKRDESSDNFTVTGTLTVTETTTLDGNLIVPEATAQLGRIGELDALSTTTSAGIGFTNQPADDGVTVASDDSADTTQTITIIGTTNGADTVVVESIALTGDTPVNSTKTDWGVILAVKLDASCAGTVTVTETSGGATITAGLTTGVLSLGVETVAAANADAYNRAVYLVCSDTGTKQIGLQGTNTSDAVIYDSQALNGTTAVESNSAFRTITEIYTGDLEATRTVTQSNNTDVDLNGAVIGYNRTAYGVGTAYTLTDSAAAIDFGTTDPAIVLAEAGTYLIFGQVHLAYAAATVAAETATVKVRRTNNTAADLSDVVVIDLPASTTLTHSYGVVPIPPFTYTTAAADDAVTLFANVSAALGAGTIDATGIGTAIVALRIY